MDSRYPTILEMARDLRRATNRAVFAEDLGLELDDWQRELLLDEEASRILLLCSRQSGKSTMAAVLALHKALYYPGSLILLLAPALRQSQELFGKVVGYYRDLDRPVPPMAEQRLALELENGSRVISLPGTEKTIRGYSGAALLICDEAARVDDGLYYSVRPMLAVSGGDLVLLSTPFGRRGVFYEEWIGDTELGGNREFGWRRYEVRADQVPRIPPAFLEEERASLPERVYAQEYECEFVEAEGQVFSEETIRSMFDPSVKPLELAMEW